MVNQLVLGEVVELLGQEDRAWFAVRAPDGYEGHATAGALRVVSKDDARKWTAAADGFSLGVELRLRGGASAGSAPWGARLPDAGDGGLLMPDGRVVAASRADRIVTGPERALTYPREAAAAAETARMWLGAPYLWGGRIRSATDCSGLVQAVFGLHGFRLPRDSVDQSVAGPRLELPSGAAVSGRPGDLWFFAWDGRPVSHVGVCLGGAEMIHASETRGEVAIDRLGEGEFGERLAAGLVAGARPVAGDPA